MVWGLALVMAAVLLRGSEERSDRSIFLFGFVMGGAYEYICSAVGELLFGVIFWDYSGFKFNLGAVSICSTAFSGASRRWSGSGTATPSSQS